MACKVCQKTFTLPSDDEYDSDAKPHVCPTCGQSFSLKIQLKRHTLLHANGEPFTCINCSKDGENEEEDEDSISYNLRLSKKGDFNCEVCNMTFSSKRLLLRHTSDEHSLESSHFCDDCPEIFETATDLKKHAATHKTTKSVSKKRTSTKAESNGSKSLSCPHCSKTFAYQASWDKHVSKCGSGEDSAKTARKRRSSTDSYDEPSSSKKSKKSFVEVYENSGQKHECDVCGKSFKRKSALDGHMITHINEEEEESDNDNSNDDVIPAYKKKKSEARDSEPKDQNVGGIKRSFICIKCNFVCFSQATLVKHVCRRDREEAASKKETKKTGPPPKPKPKNFKCSICCHSFELLEELKLHRLTHTPEGHTCEICDRSFRNEKRLKKHYKSHNVEVDDDSDIEQILESTKPRRKHSNRSKDYECNLCGKRFAGERCLLKHVEKHEQSGETVPKKRRKRSKANETLTCSFCDEEFVGRKTQYLKHMAVHTPEVCGICDERFVDRQGLREHCKVHVGTKEGQMFMECSQKALDAKLGLLPPEPKVEYIYLVLR